MRAAVVAAGVTATWAPILAALGIVSWRTATTVITSTLLAGIGWALAGYLRDWWRWLVDADVQADLDGLGHVTAITCPDCHVAVPINRDRWTMGEHVCHGGTNTAVSR